MTQRGTAGLPVSSETRLVLEQLEAGSPDAFRRLFERYAPSLRRVIASRLDGRLRHRVDPSDILQETELAVFARIDDYLRRRPMPLEHWLLRTAEQCLATARRHHCAAAKRSVARERSWPDRSSMLLAARLASRPPRCTLEYEEMVHRLEAVLSQLSELDREILLLRRVEGLSNGEAAARLGIDPAAARKRFTRALLRAREALREEGDAAGGSRPAR